jgi:hypothetical protein
VTQAKGNHLYEVLLPAGTTTLCRMPPRFRNLVWIKRGVRLYPRTDPRTYMHMHRRLHTYGHTCLYCPCPCAYRRNRPPFVGRALAQATM